MLPAGARWDDIKDLSGEALDAHYAKLLEKLAKQKRHHRHHLPEGRRTRFSDPAKLKRLVALIDSETWIGLGVDVKGTIYEGLLERNAERGEVRRRPVFHAAPADRRDGAR